MKTHEIQKITLAQPNIIIFSDYEFTKDAVTKAFAKIKVNKTLGPDCIVPRVLRKAKYRISKPIGMLFNKSLILEESPKLRN